MCSLYRSTNILSSKNNSTNNHYCPNNWQQQWIHPKWRNQITFIVTSPQHIFLGEWNSWERAPDSAETIYIYTVHTYRLIQKTMCRIHIHILSTHSVLLRHTYSYQYTLYTVCTHSAFCTHMYVHNNMRRCNRLYINWIRNVVDVHWMVSSGSR